MTGKLSNRINQAFGNSMMEAIVLTGQFSTPTDELFS